jgi:hypothetical protein
MDILGMDAIPLFFPLWIPYKRLRNIQTAGVALSSVSIMPIKLLPIPPSFTKQYPIKGDHDDITLCVQRLLEEDIIERSESFNYNSTVWLVRKPNGT